MKVIFKIAECDFCDADAVVDEPTIRRTWADMCAACRADHGTYSNIGYALVRNINDPAIGSQVCSLDVGLKYPHSEAVGAE